VKVADRRPKTKRRSHPKVNSGRSETLRIKLLGDFQVTVGSRVIGHNEADGADSFFIREEVVVAQTIHYTVEPLG
jgi:hypothetical protein